MIAMTNLYLQACSFFYMLMISILYFSKKRIDNKENKIFSIMSVINIIGIALDLIIVYLSYVAKGHISLYILNKFYLVYILLWTYYFCEYIVIITIKNENIRLIQKYANIVITFIVTIIIFILPIYLFNENNVMYTYGPSVTSLYVAEALFVVEIIIIVISNIKNVLSRKYIPLFVLIIICLIALIVRRINPGILLTTTIITYINILMYHTIENPDIKMLEQINIAKDQAEKANNAKSDFLSSMSHEIRTPLNAIVGFSEDLKEKVEDKELKEEVNDIVMASESLLEIVNGILDISKIEANKLEIVNTEYRFKKVFDELVVLSKARIGEKPLEFRYKYDDSIPPYLYGDYARLKQIILNLLTNAIKYTKEGYIDFTINSIKKDNICRLIISVEDSGIGIKKENIDKLFTKFERFDKEKNITIEGTGLGLAITKKLVELMNGNIVVQSVYGQGSKFTVAIDQKIVLKEVVFEKEDYSNTISDFSKYKVLIVDDNLINLKVARKLLESFKLKIETCDSGLSCLDKINNNEKYDLILMDDMMPKLSGVETLKKLKEIDTFNTPVVALTANAISGMKEKYLNDGFDDYLAKPINKQELTKVLNKFFLK